YDTTMASSGTDCSTLSKQNCVSSLLPVRPSRYLYGHLISTVAFPQQVQFANPSGDAPRCGLSGRTTRPQSSTSKLGCCAFIISVYCLLAVSSISLPQSTAGTWDKSCVL